MQMENPPRRCRLSSGRENQWARLGIRKGNWLRDPGSNRGSRGYEPPEMTSSPSCRSVIGAHSFVSLRTQLIRSTKFRCLLKGFEQAAGRTANLLSTFHA